MYSPSQFIATGVPAPHPTAAPQQMAPPSNVYLNGGSAFSPTNLHLVSPSHNAAGLVGVQLHPQQQPLPQAPFMADPMMPMMSPQPPQQHPQSIPPMFNDFNDQVNWLKKELKVRQK